MTSTPGRGAQVILAGDAQKAARGARRALPYRQSIGGPSS